MVSMDLLTILERIPHNIRNVCFKFEDWGWVSDAVNGLVCGPMLCMAAQGLFFLKKMYVDIDSLFKCQNN